MGASLLALAKSIYYISFVLSHAADQMNFNILKLYIGPLILDSVEVLDY